MNKDDILIVKYPLFMRDRDVKALYESILRQKESGVIILPDYCDIIVAPKDTELYVEQRERVNIYER